MCFKVCVPFYSGLSVLPAVPTLHSIPGLDGLECLSFPVYILQRDMAHNFIGLLIFFSKRVGKGKFNVIGLCRQNFRNEIWIPIGT
jgi:hypothetical protein